MKTGSHKYFALAVMCMMVNVALGQRYPFHELSVDDGLIQSQATSLAQDKMGNLWIGTLGGLSKYDGVEFTNYTVRNGLLNNTVYAVSADDSGYIWIGGPSGLSKFNGKSFVHYRQNNDQPTLNSSEQIQITYDTVWWRTQGVLYYVTKGIIREFYTPAKRSTITGFLADHEILLVAGDSVVYRLHDHKWDSLYFEVPEDQKYPMTYKFFRDSKNTVWVAANTGLYRIEGNKIVPHLIGNVITDQNSINAITEDKEGALWLATTTGIKKLYGDNEDYYNKHKGLSDNNFYDVLTDREGNVWMASDGQGVFRFSGSLFTSLDETLGLPSAQIMSIATNKRDSLFLGTYDAGLHIFKDGKVSSLPFPSDHAPAITSLCYASDGKLWIGTRGRGLWEYCNDIFKQYTTVDNNFPSNAVTSLYEDPQHRLWIGFANGILLYEHKTFSKVTDKNFFVRSFLNIGNDSVLIVTDRGLGMYAGGIVTDLITHAAPDSNAILCAVKKGNELWLGSSDNGVIRYDMITHKAMVINKSKGLRSDFIYNIIADDNGDIWAGTGFGIHRISLCSADEPMIDFYGKAQGITGMESNINSVLKMPDGSIWFGTTNGAVHYQPSAKSISSAPVSVALRSVKIAGETSIDHQYYDSTDNWYAIPYHLRLPYRKNNITFTFQGITLSSAQQVFYRYRLYGLEDTSWCEWCPNNAVTFSALPPGKYVFRLQCSGGNRKEVRELSYAFEIITPFHQTAWFRLCILLSCLLAGFLIQHLISKSKERKKRLLEKLRSEEQAKVRLRTAEDFHDEIGNKLTRINVLTNVLKSKIAPQPDTSRLLMQIEDNTSQLYGGVRDILWSLKPSNDVLYEILQHIGDVASELFGDTDIEFTLTGIHEVLRKYKMPMDMSRNLIMIFKEAFNNIMKYAGAKHVSVEVQMKKKHVLHLILKDDGVGFDTRAISKGNGIKNMQLRAERLGGRLYLDSRHGKGTTITVTFKIPPNR